MRYPTIQRTIIFATLFFIGQTAALAASSQKLLLLPGSAVWLIGDSTLHPFTNRATQMRLTTDIEPSIVITSAKDLLGAILQQHALTQFALSIPVKELRSKDASLDKNMEKTLKAETCPSIDFHMTHYDVLVDTSLASGSPVRVSGMLNVACHEQPITLDGLLIPDQNILRIQGQYSLRMTDYGVKPPTMMMGTIKVKNQVAIHFDLQLNMHP